MTRNKTSIPNPNRISEKELNFIQSIDSTELPPRDSKTQDDPSLNKYKGRMISMSDSFYKTLNDYIKENPTEGNKSSFVVRIVAEYIKTKTSA